jgi:hypothetical protein
MFSKLIEDSSSLIARLDVLAKAYDDYSLREYENMPHSQMVACTEIDGWYNAATDLVLLAFGQGSRQIQKWNALMEKNQNYDALPPHNRGGNYNPLYHTISSIKEMTGLLREYSYILDARDQLDLKRSDRSHLSNRSLAETSDKVPTLQSNESIWCLIIRVIGGLSTASVGYAVLLRPEVGTWPWLQNHPNRIGLYLSGTAIVTALAWAIVDHNPRRRGYILGSIVLGLALVLIQIIGK